jgi:hypothetical protein
MIPQLVFHPALRIHFLGLALGLPVFFFCGFGFRTLIAAASSVFLMCEA